MESDTRDGAMKDRPLTQKQFIYAEGILKGLTGIQAAMKAGYKGNEITLANVSSENLKKTYIKNYIDSKRREISKRTAITVEYLQNKLVETAKEAAEAGRYGAVVSAYTTLLKTIGGLQADRLPAENLIGKALDAKKQEDINKALELVYSRKYLAGEAVRTVESTIVGSGVVQDGRTEAEGMDVDTGQDKADFQKQDPIDPPSPRP